jgi:hypothetical protein
LRRSQAVGGKIGIPLLIKRQDEPFFLNIAVSVDYFGAACLKGKVTSIAIRYISDQARKILAEPHTWGPNAQWIGYARLDFIRTRRLHQYVRLTSIRRFFEVFVPDRWRQSTLRNFQYPFFLVHVCSRDSYSSKRRHRFNDQLSPVNF